MKSLGPQKSDLCRLSLLERRCVQDRRPRLFRKGYHNQQTPYLVWKAQSLDKLLGSELTAFIVFQKKIDFCAEDKKETESKRWTSARSVMMYLWKSTSTGERGRLGRDSQTSKEKRVNEDKATAEESERRVEEKGNRRRWKERGEAADTNVCFFFPYKLEFFCCPWSDNSPLKQRRKALTKRQEPCQHLPGGQQLSSPRRRHAIAWASGKQADILCMLRHTRESTEIGLEENT